MIRLLFFAVCAAILIFGWFLIAGSGKESDRGPKFPVNKGSTANAPTPAFKQVPFWKSEGSRAKSNDPQSVPDQSEQQQTALNSDAKSTSIKAPFATQQSTGYPTAANSSMNVSGSAPNSNAQIPSAFSGSGVGGAPREISIPVPEGAKVPAVFFDVEEKPLAQQKALDRIAKEFEKNVSEIPPGLTKEEVWDAAREIADERYLTLFGYQAYNQYHIQSAKEALKEKRARANAAGP